MSEKVAPMNDMTSHEGSSSLGASSTFDLEKINERNQKLRQHAIYHSLYRLFPNYTQNAQVYSRIKKSGLYFESDEFPRWMGLPGSRFRTRWDLFIIFLVIYNVLVIPLDLAFNTTENFPDSLKFIDPLIDSFFAIDIILNFRTAIVTYDGVLITEQSSISANYISKWFFIDLVATMPFEYLLVGTDTDLTILAILKTPRLFRIGRILRYLENMQYANFMRIGRLFILFFILVHWVGCIWILIKEWPEGWNDYDNESKYVRGIFDAAQMLVGENIEPQNYSERTFVMIVMFTAACINASIFGNMAVLIQNFDKQGRKHTEKMDLINEHMWYSQIPGALAQDIQNYYDLLWIRQRELFHSKDPFVDLSMGLKKALKCEQYTETVLRTPVLKTSSPGFLEELLIELKPQMAMPMFMLSDEGSMGNDMYLVSKGQLKVFVNGNWVGKITEGDFFGEVALLLKWGRRSATIITHMYCDLFRLKRNSFQNLMFDYPNDVDTIMKVAKQRFIRTGDMLDWDTKERMSIAFARDPDIWRSIYPQETDSIRPLNKAWRSAFKSGALVSTGEPNLVRVTRDYEERRKSVMQNLPIHFGRTVTHKF